MIPFPIRLPLIIATGIMMLFMVPVIDLSAQVIPSYRTMDWSVAGAGYDFNANQGVWVDVTSFGVTGDGITDNYAALTSAVQSLGGSRGTLFFPAGRYLINGFLNLPDSITLLGANADSTVLLFNAGENNHAIKVNGSVAGSFVPVMGGALKNSMKLVVADASPFIGAVVAELIQDGNQHMTSSWAMSSLGQMVLIDSVAGDTLYLKHPLRLDYDSLLSPRIRPVNPRRAVSIECLRIERVDQTTSSTANILFYYAWDCRIMGVESRFCNFAHVDVRLSANITVRSSYFHEGHGYGSGGKAYGVCVHSTSGSCLVVNNIFRKLRHSILLQSGANGNVFAYNFSTDPYWTDVAAPANSAGDIVLHGNYPYLNLFEGNIVQNIVIDDSHGKNGHHNTFFRNRAELYGIIMSNNPATDSVNLVGNEVTNTGTLMGLYYLNGVNHFQHGNSIKGTLTPAGTGSLPDISCYSWQTPPFWNIPDHYPPIGPPNTAGSFSNPAALRFLYGVGLATCNDTSVTNSIAEHTNQPGSFEILRCHYSKAYSRFEIVISSNGIDLPVTAEVFSLTGIKLVEQQINSSTTLNHLSLPYPDASPGLYIARVSLGGVSKQAKVMVF
jgi:hypothetical protein